MIERRHSSRGPSRSIAASLRLVCWVASTHWACALTNKAEPMTPRYFSPASEIAEARAEAPSAGRLELRLGEVDSAAHLEERIAYRVSDTELGYYEHRRWTEPPERYLRRALSHELFDTRGLGRVVSGSAVTLDVELVSFEELREGGPRARVALRFSLRDDQRSLLERGVVLDEPMGTSEPADSGQAFAKAMSVALSRAVALVADQVQEQLAGAAVSRAEPGAPSGSGPALP